MVEAAKSSALCQSSHDIARGVTAFHSRPSRDGFLSEFQRPVIVISGDDDIAPGPRASAKLAASAPKGAFHAISSCGHYVPLEQPKVLNSILRKAIAAHTRTEDSQIATR